MELGQPLADDQPQPQEQRQLRVGQVVGELGDGVHERVLEDVGRVDPALEPAVEPGIDHPPQPGAVPDQRLAGGRSVACRRSLDQPEVFRLVHDSEARGHRV